MAAKLDQGKTYVLTEVTFKPDTVKPLGQDRIIPNHTDMKILPYETSFVVLRQVKDGTRCMTLRETPNVIFVIPDENRPNAVEMNVDGVKSREVVCAF